MNQIVAENDEIEHSDLPVNLVFQSYHLMVALFGVIVLVLILAAIAAFKKGSKLGSKKWVQWVLILSPLAPFIAIQSGWSTAEFGRQPYVVYPSVSGPDGVSLLTNEAASQSVTPPELMITIALFAVVYLLLLLHGSVSSAKLSKRVPCSSSKRLRRPAPTLPIGRQLCGRFRCVRGRKEEGGISHDYPRHYLVLPHLR